MHFVDRSVLLPRSLRFNALWQSREARLLGYCDRQIGKPRVQFEYQPFDKLVVAVLMHSTFNSRRIPDTVSEELVAALLNSKSHEFTALFSVIHSALKARNAANCSEEILRLRTYDKLQNLVREGQVTKIGKTYKGVITALHPLRKRLKELRKKHSPPRLVSAHPPS